MYRIEGVNVNETWQANAICPTGFGRRQVHTAELPPTRNMAHQPTSSLHDFPAKQIYLMAAPTIKTDHLLDNRTHGIMVRSPMHHF